MRRQRSAPQSEAFVIAASTTGLIFGRSTRRGGPACARREGTLARDELAGRTGPVGCARERQRDGCDAAEDAVRRWRFEPARRSDDPVAMWVRLPVEFRLR